MHVCKWPRSKTNPQEHYINKSTTTPIARALKNYSSWSFLGPATAIFVANLHLVLCRSAISFAALRVFRRALVFGRASSQNQKGPTHFHRVPALREVIGSKPL